MKKKLLSVLLTLVIAVSAFDSFSVISSAESAVAQVIDSNGNATNYTTFEDAWKAAVNDRKTFKLLSDWRESGNFGASVGNAAHQQLFFNGGALSVMPGFSVTIDLNGHKICRNKGVNNMTDDGSVIRLFDGASITINDTSESGNGSIEGGSSNYGGGIYAPSNNTVTMNGGRIRLCNGYYGGGVYIDSSSKFIMNGGAIEQNTGYYGGGVYAEDDALFEAHGGRISENRATYDGGGIYLWSANGRLDNISVTDNKAKNGGAIYSDYNVVKNYSSLDIVNSEILNNTADNYYGGIYHCAGYFGINGNTRIFGNKNEGYYGGGVYSQKVPIYISGSVQIFGNFTQSNLRKACDVNFGKSLNEAFVLKGGMGNSAMVGVYITNGTKPTYWCRSYHLYRYGDCSDTDNNMKSLADCLFSNTGSTGFVYSDTIDSHYQDRTWHNTIVTAGGQATTYDVKVTQVRYKGVILSPSDYSSDYNPNSRTITLNVPDYVKDTYLLKVYANIKDSGNRWDEGREITFEYGVDVTEGQAIIINTSNKAPTYTAKVSGGTVDGMESGAKKYFEPLTIAPTVPDGKIFSHWEIEGDLAVDIQGFEKYAKSPAELYMPQQDVTFKAVFKDAVTRVDITLPQPNGSEKTDLYPTAAVSYKAADGAEIKSENVKVTWRKNSIYDRIEKFDYNTQYIAEFSLIDGRDWDFGFADAENIKLYLNGKELSDEHYTYASKLETGVLVSGKVPESFPVNHRILYVDYKLKTAKAPVLSVESPSIEIPKGAGIEKLRSFLPDSVKLTYEGIDGDKTASVEVSWGELPSSIGDTFTISGIVAIPEELEATEDKMQTVVTVTVSDKTRLQKPTASVNDGGQIPIGEKITLSSPEGAAILYRIDDGAFAEYSADIGIVPQGAAGTITEHKITAYCTKEGFLQSEYLTLIISVDNESVHTVKIVDKSGAVYGYASGAGEYTSGDSVTIKATESDPEKIAVSWSAEGITLSDTDKTSASFTFTMPTHDVTITVQDFRYYVSKLYLSSITPVADNPLPQTLEIIGGEDIFGNAFDKDDILMKVALNQWQKYNEDTGLYEPIAAGSISENGKKYLAAFSVEPNSSARASCDNLEIYIDDEKIIPSFSFQGHYIIGWEFNAVYDELLGVNLGDSITAYTGNYVDFPEEIGVKTKYGSITTAGVTWSGTDSIDTSTPAGDYGVIATLALPDNVIATDEKRSISVTVKVRELINSVALEAVGGSVPTKAGESLPTALGVIGSGAYLVENSFGISPSTATAVTGTEYTITVAAAPTEYCEFAANTVFTLNGTGMSATPSENGQYELSYTFTAQEVKSHEVTVNGGEAQIYNEGDLVEISTSAYGFNKWTAETVYETTETVIGDNGEQKEIIVIHRNPVNLFTEGNEYKATSLFLMPRLADGSRLELTASYNHGIIGYDNNTKTADILADRAYTGVRVVFAAYTGRRLTSVKWFDADLAEGLNTVTAPESFTTEGADTVKVMVWENFYSIKPLFGAYEESVGEA